jgi:CHAD domain-containing protein
VSPAPAEKPAPRPRKKPAASAASVPSPPAPSEAVEPVAPAPVSRRSGRKSAAQAEEQGASRSEAHNADAEALRKLTGSPRVATSPTGPAGLVPPPVQAGRGRPRKPVSVTGELGGSSGAWRGKSQRLKFDPSLPLRAALQMSMSSVLSFASNVASNAQYHPLKAVHEFRKSIRRARSVLNMCHPALNARDYKKLENELRDAGRLVSMVRDVDVLSDLAAQLAQDEPEIFSALPLAVRKVTASIEAPSPVETLHRIGPGLAAVGLTFGSAVHDDLSWGDVRDGLRRTYRAARKAFREARSGRSDEAIHAWRKRSKAVRYQLELLASGGAEPVDDLRIAFTELTEKLGVATDMSAMRRLLSKRVEESPELARALAALRERSRELAKETLGAAKSLFDAKPGAWAQTVVGSLEALRSQAVTSSTPPAR